MIPDTPRETAVDALVRALSARIVAGALGPGARLEEQSLAVSFRVSRTPVREALARLAAMGLVERRPHRGVIVAGLSMDRLLNLFELMTELEGVCARLAALRMTEAERARLAADHEAARVLALAEDVERYADANRAFHLRVYDGAHNPELVAAARGVRTRLAPFRRAQFLVAGRPSASWAEHDRVVRAIAARDEAEAAAAMRAHLLRVRDAYRSFAGAEAPPEV